jgi:predicted metal-binding membrane protein
MEPDLDRTLARVPFTIAALGLIGSAFAWRFGGFRGALAFLTGAVAAWFNFQLIRRFVIRLLGAFSADPAKRPKAAGLRLVLQLTLFLAGAFVILRFSGLNIVLALYGLLVCPAAVMLVSIGYLITYYGH